MTSTEIDQPTTTDELAADAAAADPVAAAVEPELPVGYPEGAPRLQALHRMRYGVRGRASKRWNDLVEFQKDHPEIDEFEKVRAAAKAVGEDPPESPIDVEVMCDMLELIDQFMLSVAVDPDEYENWPDRFDPSVFSQTFQAYQAASSPGEASSSSS